MSAPLVLQAGLAALESAGASIALPLAAELVTRLQPRSAGRRHLVWAMVFALLLALPALLAVTPSLTVVRLAPAPAVTAMPVALPSGPDWTGLALLAGVGLWILGAALLTAHRLVAFLALERLRRRSVRTMSMEGVELRHSDLCPGPITWGRVILLPVAARHWPAEQLHAVLAHELAHVRRRDSLVQAFAGIACALYWPNPLVWSAARALRREAEIAADDAVIASGVRPSAYADLLVSLARQRHANPKIAFAMAGPSGLSDRIRSILSPLPLRNGASPMDIVKLAGLGVLAAGTLLAVRPSLADTPVQSAPLAPVASTRPAAPATPAPAAAAKPAKPKVRRHAMTLNKDTVVIDGQPRTLTPEEQAELDRKLAEIGPTVSRAIAEAHIEETVRRAIAAHNAEVQAEVQAKVAAQLAEIGPRIQKALADAHIDDQVARRMAEIQPRIDAAIAHANARAAEAQRRAEEAAERASRQAQ